MKKLMKSILISAVCFFTVFTSLQATSTVVEAAGNNTLDGFVVPDAAVGPVTTSSFGTGNSFQVTFDGVTVDDLPAAFFINGERVYCIEPVTKTALGYEYLDGSTSIPLVENQRNYLKTIAWYGFGYNGDNTDIRQIAAQVMIWRYLGATVSNTSTTLENKISDIQSSIDKTNSTPSFNGQTIHLKGYGVGYAQTITDTSGALAAWGNNAATNGNGLHVDVSGNSVKIWMDKGASASSINFVAGNNGYVGGGNTGNSRKKMLVYISPSDAQKLMQLGDPNYHQATLNADVAVGQVSLTKHDAQTGATAQGDATFVGAEYTLTTASGTAVGTLTTKADGSTNTIGDLATDTTYLIKETKAPVGYELDPTTYIVDFSTGTTAQNGVVITSKVATTSLEQIKTGNFDITKVIGQNQSGPQNFEQGAIFEVKLESDIAKNGYAAAKVYDTLTTDSQGYAKSTDLPYGTYRVVQKTAGTVDLEKSPNFSFVVGDTAKPTKHYIVNNQEFTSYLKIVKQDVDSGKTIAISNTTFKIWDVTNKKYYSQKVAGKAVDTFTTDESGSVMTPLQMNVGNYELDEVFAPTGYLISKDRMSFTITSAWAHEVDGDGDAVITLTAQDKRVTGSVELVKTGDVVTGYDKTKQEFTYEQRGLKDAEFDLIAKSDILDPADGTVLFKKDSVVKHITSDENGQVKVDDLYLGDYALVETNAPTGYVLDTKEYEFTLTYKDENTAVITHSAALVNQKQSYELNIGKVDEQDTTKYLAGAEFTLYANRDVYNVDGDVIIKQGDAVKTFTSSAEGRVKVDISLPTDLSDLFAPEETTPVTPGDVTAPTNTMEVEAGTTIVNDSTSQYVLKETKAPTGYDSKKVNVYIDTKYTNENQAVVTINYNFENKEIIKDFKIKKVDSLTKELLKSKELEFSSFKDAEGISKIESAKQESDDFVHFKLKYGTYYIKETKAPLGYILSTQVVQVVVNDEGVFVDGVKSDSATIEYSNTMMPAMALVNTGDSGNGSMIMLLIVSAVLALFVFANKKRKDLAFATASSFSDSTPTMSNPLEQDLDAILSTVAVQNGYYPEKKESLELCKGNQTKRLGKERDSAKRDVGVKGEKCAPN